MKSLFNLVAIITMCLCWLADSGLSSSGAEHIEHSDEKNSSVAVSIEAENDDETNSPLDLFVAKEAVRRSDIDTIWYWDQWCQQQNKVGSCSTPVVRYYYNAQLDQCMTFGYSGCGANKNNFKTLVECERHCKGTIYMTPKVISRSSNCELQPNAGLCLSLTERYYFDVNTNRCKMFIYGGCGGNQNRFPSKEICQSQCGDGDHAAR